MTSNILNVSVHSDFSEFPTEKRYDASLKISELKKRLELITGVHHETMKISLFINDNLIGELDKNDETLGHYVGGEVVSGQTLKLVVKDDQGVNPMSGDVPKYTIPEEKYQERQNNARNFIKEAREKLEINK